MFFYEVQHSRLSTVMAVQTTIPKQPMGTDFLHDQTNYIKIPQEDEYEDTNKDRLKEEIFPFPSQLDALQQDLQDVRDRNLAFAEENNQLCNDIQELIAENSHPISVNKKLRKCLQAQQQRSHNLEMELHNCLQKVQDELSKCEMKQIDARFQLKFKLSTAAIERDQFRAQIKKLENDNKVMSETITHLQKQMMAKRDQFSLFNPFYREIEGKIPIRKGHSSGPLYVMGRSSIVHEKKINLTRNPHSFTTLHRLMRNNDTVGSCEGTLYEEFPGRSA